MTGESVTTAKWTLFLHSSECSIHLHVHSAIFGGRALPNALWEAYMCSLYTLREIMLDLLGNTSSREAALISKITHELLSSLFVCACSTIIIYNLSSQQLSGCRAPSVCTACRLPRITATILKQQQPQGLHSPTTFWHRKQSFQLYQSLCRDFS